MKKDINRKTFTYSWFIFSICIVITIALIQGYFEYKNAVGNATIKTNNLTILLTKKLENDFEEIDNILKFAEDIILTLPKENKIFLENSFEQKTKIVSEKFNYLINNFEDIDNISYANPNGEIIYSSSQLNFNMDLANKPYFQDLKTNTSLTKTFSNIIVSQNKEQFLARLHAIKDENGNLLGVLIAFINMHTINNTLSSINIGEGGVSLIRSSDNSELISRYPMTDNLEVYKPLPPSNPIFIKIKNGEKAGGLEYIASTDKHKRVGSFIVMDKYPFYVQVAISEQEYLEHWKRNLLIVAILIILFILIAFLVFIAIKKSYKKEQTAIIELMKTRDFLMTEKNRLANIITGTNAGTWEWNVQTNEVIFNEKWANMIGYTLDEIEPADINTWMKFVQPDDLEKSKQLLRKHFNKELDYYESEMRMKHKNGSWIWIKARGKVISWNEKDKPIIMMGTHIDVTKEKILIQEMELVKNRFENMFKTHSSIMLLTDPNNRKIIDANQSAIDFYGYTIDELKGMDISKINLLEAKSIEEKQQEAKGSIKNLFIFFHKLKNGDIRTVEVHSSPIETNSGVILFSIIKDITKEQELKNEILKEKIKFQTFINLSSDAIAILDINTGKLLEYSRQTKKYLGYSDEEMKNLTILDWDKDIKNIEEYRNNIVSMIGYDTTFIERVHKRRNGSYYNAAISLVKITLDGEDFIYSSARDITNEKLIQKKLQESYKNLERLIESQDNIVILTDGEQIKFANQKLFDFLGFRNLNDFNKKHKCICELFIEKENFFSIKNDTWLKEIKILEESKRIVAIAGKDFQEHAFSVKMNNFDDETMIVSFTDISQTISKNIYLEKKIMHDKLTNAYNREFFDKNYKNLINKYHTNDSNLAIAMLDIDHFKAVNDTYGHDIGDDVLIRFVEIINKSSRQNDILIRWGGEEFILILQLKSPNDLPKILENLRKTIEQYNFPKVGQKTCSFGGTIYQNDEDILKTIKRADEAVYEAKAAGRNKVIII
ncbi:hypothetical protein CRU92_05215 [Arcobacter sp. FW59]|nr:hypothetical protein CRU92_05215 [Arcobacter sp. FW59]